MTANRESAPLPRAVVRRSAGRALLTIAALAGVAACGSGPTSQATTNAGGASSPAGSPSPTPESSPTPPPPPALELVWVVHVLGHQSVRLANLGGGPAHQVAIVPQDASVLAADHGRVAFVYADRSIHVVNLSSGANTAFPGGGDVLFGGAFSPDGSRLAYVTGAQSTLQGQLKVLTLATRAVSVLRTFPSNTYDIPVRWSDTAIEANVVVAFADGNNQAVVLLDPTTGARTSMTETPGSTGPLSSGDGMHAADSAHSALGDDSDFQGGPGPQGPFNTLRGIAVGSPVSSVLTEAHHNITVLAVLADGSAMGIDDEGAAGGFAGISLSSDFGLFVVVGGAKTQLAHIGARFDAATFLQDGSLTVAERDGAAEKLISMGPGHGNRMLDSVNGGDGAFVALIPAS